MLTAATFLPLSACAQPADGTAARATITLSSETAPGEPLNSDGYAAIELFPGSRVVLAAEVPATAPSGSWAVHGLQPGWSVVVMPTGEHTAQVTIEPAALGAGCGAPGDAPTVLEFGDAGGFVLYEPIIVSVDCTA